MCLLFYCNKEPQNFLFTLALALSIYHQENKFACVTKFSGPLILKAYGRLYLAPNEQRSLVLYRLLVEQV